MTAAIFWFRQDLRCTDNPGLAAACRSHDSIIPVYIANENPLETVGAAQCWWLHNSLESLKKNLQQHGLDLCLRHGSPLAQLLNLIEHHAVDTVYWNRCYEPSSIERDRAIKTTLASLGITVKSFNGSLLMEPWNISNQSNNPFKVFTPFWKESLRQITIPKEYVIEKWPTCPAFQSDTLANWQLLPKSPNWAFEFEDFWKPGELSASKKLRDFITNHLMTYKEHRNIPMLRATSELSPHLHFGEISPWQIWRAIADEKLNPNYNAVSADNFLSELGWREFSYHLLYHYPSLPDENFKPAFNSFKWQQDELSLKSWQQGLTGFPIVDAGMRELWRTGYMHNRVRMIAASFLIKDLLIDWRTGAEWFLHTLLDADLANNSASWQWVAGSGADAAPYFRIFNPVLQGEKFDPQGDYVKRWVNELATVPTQWIHKPWMAPTHSLPITLGKDYPYPIVDHANARLRALAAYKML